MRVAQITSTYCLEKHTDIVSLWSEVTIGPIPSHCGRSVKFRVTALRCYRDVLFKLALAAHLVLSSYKRYSGQNICLGTIRYSRPIQLIVACWYHLLTKILYQRLSMWCRFDMCLSSSNKSPSLRRYLTFHYIIYLCGVSTEEIPFSSM